jgi:hypothetical protein
MQQVNSQGSGRNTGSHSSVFILYAHSPHESGTAGRRRRRHGVFAARTVTPVATWK